MKFSSRVNESNNGQIEKVTFESLSKKFTQAILQQGTMPGMNLLEEIEADLQEISDVYVLIELKDLVVKEDRIRTHTVKGLLDSIIKRLVLLITKNKGLESKVKEENKKIDLILNHKEPVLTENPVKDYPE